jgi:uncharacterized membrane protein
MISDNALPSAPAPFRDVPVDVLRGLAIAVMILANMSGALLLHAPDWYRFISSLAAPSFILLAGMMVALSRIGKGRSLAYMAARGGLTILVAVVLDTLILNIVPFLGIDVLYLIGLGIPVAYLYLGLPERKRWIVILLIFCATPLLQAGLGYHPPAGQVPLSSLLWNTDPGTPLPGPADILRSWLIDGWFPIFPWIAFPLLGAEIGAYRWNRDRPIAFRPAKEGLCGIGLLAIGGTYWALFPGPCLIREGYVELFYPPTPGLLLICIGFFIAALTLLDQCPFIGCLDPFRAMGECALAVYLVHYAIIVDVIAPFGLRLPMPQYLVVFLVLLAGMILLAFLIRAIRLRWHKPPYLVRFLIGG